MNLQMATANSTMQCGAVTTWSIFLKILIIDTPLLTHDGELWVVSCEFEVRFTFCCYHRSAVCNIVINWAATVPWSSDNQFLWVLWRKNDSYNKVLSIIYKLHVPQLPRDTESPQVSRSDSHRKPNIPSPDSEVPISLVPHLWATKRH